MFQLYSQVLVQPTLEYCSTIWNPYQKDQFTNWRWFSGELNGTLQTGTIKKQYFGNVGPPELGITGIQKDKSSSTTWWMCPQSVNKQMHQIEQEEPTPRSSVRFQHQPRKHRNSFFPRTVTAWNSLPSAVAEVPVLVSVKQGLSTIKILQWAFLGILIAMPVRRTHHLAVTVAGSVRVKEMNTWPSQTFPNPSVFLRFVLLSYLSFPFLDYHRRIKVKCECIDALCRCRNLALRMHVPELLLVNQ